MTREVKKACKTPCKACPFRKDSMKGWLGAYDDPEHFITVHYRQDQINPCHMTVDYDRDDWKDQLPDATGCAGQQIMYKNGFKLPRAWKLDPALGEDRDSVFTSTAEFVAHHTLPSTSDDDSLPPDAPDTDAIEHQYEAGTEADDVW